MIFSQLIDWPLHAADKPRNRDDCVELLSFDDVGSRRVSVRQWIVLA